MRAFAILDTINYWVGKVIRWFLLLMVFVTCGIVVLRYFLQSGNLVFLQETLLYLHGLSFMLGIAWTLQRDAHVRVDVFYGAASWRFKAWINALGALVFLLPVSGFLLTASWEFVARSWSIAETSQESGGIPALFLLKSAVLLMPALLIVQGLSELGKNAVRLSLNMELRDA